MNRRGFFATLLAPVIARFAPAKPKPQEVLFSFQTGWFKLGDSKIKTFYEVSYEGVAESVVIVPGDIIYGSNLVTPNPRTGFRLRTPDGRF